MAGRKGFDQFEPIFGEAKAEEPEQAAVTAAAVNAAALRPFLFYIHALDSSRLDVIASDFHSLTCHHIFTVDLLEDLRDDIGIAGPWSEFVDYLVASFSSVDVKLILGGEACVQLVAHKSKGLPHISLPLNILTNASASDAMANFSLALFRAFKDKHNDATKEHERFLQLKGLLSSEKERSENLQKQIGSLSFLSKRKALKSKALEKATPLSDSIEDSSAILVSDTQQPSGDVEMPSVKVTQPRKISQRAAPVSRRAKVRGVSLQNSENGND